MARINHVHFQIFVCMFFNFVGTFSNLVGTFIHHAFSVVKEKKRRRNFFPFLFGVFYNFTTYNDVLLLNQWRRPKTNLKSIRNPSKNHYMNIQKYLSLVNLKRENPTWILMHVAPNFCNSKVYDSCNLVWIWYDVGLFCISERIGHQ